jgi:hypothetical protein
MTIGLNIVYQLEAFQTHCFEKWTFPSSTVKGNDPIQFDLLERSRLGDWSRDRNLASVCLCAVQLISIFFRRTISSKWFNQAGTIIELLDIVHRPVLYVKHDVSETGFCLRPQVKLTQLDPIDRATPCLRRWGLVVSIRVKRKACTWGRRQNIVSETYYFTLKFRTTDNVQKFNNCIDTPLSQNFRSWCVLIFFLLNRFLSSFFINIIILNMV